MPERMGAPIIFDRGLVARRLRRRTVSEDFVTRLVLDDLAERLLAVTRPVGRAIIMAPDPTPLPEAGRTAEGTFDYERAGTVLGDLDPEELTLPRSDYDLIVSILDLTIVNDVPGFLARVRAHLRPDGLFLAAVLGGDTLTELRQAFLAADAEVSGGAYARVAPFLPLADAGPLLQRTGFAIPVTDIESHKVRYADALVLMRELKALGASNPLLDRPSRMATKTLIAVAAANYATDPDGRIPATLEIVWLSGWAPHESQQKPLKPGSAEISLTKVLRTKG
jgi:SAM-dependent methyltransferase